MSFVVAIRIQLEGDVEIFREMIMQYREDCLANESGMEQFLICSIPDDEKGFLLFEVFSNQEAHQLHSQGEDLQKLLQSMQEQNMRMEVMMMGGEEIESETQPILN
jgi:quinol monooxygenase YgiN